ncbi:unnamed protein product [Mucor hiemalis]
MFSKAKRFPEAGKDYIPGPGEYDLAVDEMGRHKRYGFLTQTNRFHEGSLDPTAMTENDEEDQTTILTTLPNESTTSITSTSSDTRLSSTSSIKTTATADEHSPTMLKSPSYLRKSPTSPVETTSHHKQKEMEALLAKLHKMEAIIEALEGDKNATKAILITKDLEMADLRSKNTTLQKTIHRQEKSTKAAQLQKKIEQLEEQITNLKSEHEKDLTDKDEKNKELSSDLNRSNIMIEELQLTQREKEMEIEALEAQNKLFTAQISEFECTRAENETQIKNLQQELEDMKVTHINLTHDLENCKQQVETLQLKNNELLIQIQANNDTISHLETRVTLKDEEIDALLNTIEERNTTIEENVALIESLQTQFKTYRHWIDHNAIPHLRIQRKEIENHHYAELNLLLTELHEAKKFINRQAQHLNGLKSDVHWLNVQNEQLSDIVTNMIKDGKEFFSINTATTTTTTTTKKKVFSTNVFKPKRKQQQTIKNSEIIPMDVSDTATLSFSSRSTFSNDNSTHSSSKNTEVENPLDSNLLVLNDSGFGILIDEAK